jgi:hypothetical protein
MPHDELMHNQHCSYARDLSLREPPGRCLPPPHHRAHCFFASVAGRFLFRGRHVASERELGEQRRRRAVAPRVPLREVPFACNLFEAFGAACRRRAAERHRRAQPAA